VIWRRTLTWSRWEAPDDDASARPVTDRLPSAAPLSSGNGLATLLEQEAKREVSYADFLDDVLTREVGAKTQKHLAMRIAMARFPSRKRWRTSTSNSNPLIDMKG
jgi:DNA replication protein DnaC